MIKEGQFYEILVYFLNIIGGAFCGISAGIP